VLYEMATGRAAFLGSTTAVIFQAILDRAPALPSRLNPELPAELERIIYKALEKDRDLRYQAAAELRGDLKRLKRDTDSSRSAASMAIPEAPPSGPSVAIPAVAAPARAKWPRFVIPAGGAVLLVAAVAAFFYFRRPPALSERDSIVLADFSNTTGDPVFEGTLKQALAVQLEQSPYLNVLPEAEVRKTLLLMNRAAEERVAGPLAREVCERVGSKAMLAGSISGLGSHFVIALEAMNCSTGATLAREQVEADSKEKVLQALGKAASGMRGKLGESLASIQKLDAPIEATTSSLEALKAFSLGEAQRAKGAEAEAAPFYKRATELDPNFALAYARLGTVYRNTGNDEPGVENHKKAFELRDRASEREKFYITAHYYDSVTGEINKAIEALTLWTQTYPRDKIPHGMLAYYYDRMGQYEKAAEEAREEFRVTESDALAYGHLAGAYMGLNRFQEAKEISEKAVARKLDSLSTHVGLYTIAFIQGDTAAMEREAAWARGKPAEYYALGVQGDAAFAAGRLRAARESYRAASEMAQAGNEKENAATIIAEEAVREAICGNSRLAQDRAAAALALARTRNTIPQAALALALAGDSAQAQKIIDELARRYPSDTLLNAVSLPTAHAAAEIHRGAAEKAAELLRPATPYDLSNAFGGMPVYLRGQGYLRARAGAEAAAQFQKILDHRGALPFLYPLAHLGAARAWELAGDTAKSKKLYQDFLALWKDADADVPVLKEAKQEYAKLH
ncbi:MAG: hypothetical protein HY236_07045, partial [Acidobacteria bacterium]|nr:hypothetical protein [Acidobacteriota bacterium]